MSEENKENGFNRMSKTFHQKLYLIFSVLVFNDNESKNYRCRRQFIYPDLMRNLLMRSLHTNVHFRVFLCCSPTNYCPTITATSYGSYE